MIEVKTNPSGKSSTSMKFFSDENKSALEAKEEAQRIAFAPMIFQATRILRDCGILGVIEAARDEGLTESEIAERVKIPPYGVRVLLEAGLGIGILIIQNEKYKLTKTGFFILNDELTRVNMDFAHDVCYQGMFALEESIMTGKPEGLKVFGSWKTIYEGLSQLPPKAKKSWFRFDHFYSDTSFAEVLPHVFNAKPEKILDIGGNTGRWSLQCVKYDPDVEVTIMDLPGQLEMAAEQIKKEGFENRVKFHACNLLDESQPFPKGFDVIWMSQFLDCFSDEEIVSILGRCHRALDENGFVFILEPFWDRQRFLASAFSLQMTSLYFTAMANGNSQMYYSPNFLQFVQRAGFEVISLIDLGISHTLLQCKPVK